MARDDLDSDGKGGNLKTRFSLLSFAQKVAVGTATAVLSAAVLAALGLQTFSGSGGPATSATTRTSDSAATSSSTNKGAAATGSSPATAGTEVSTDGAIPLASSYSGVGRNARLNRTGRLALSNVVESSTGAITGQVIWSSGLRGSGPFTGAVRGSAIAFTNTIASPQECDYRCTSIAYTGTIGTDGRIAGSYVAYQTDGDPQRGTWELTPSTRGT